MAEIDKLNETVEPTLEEEQANVLEEVIHGTNDVFDKEYDFLKELGLKIHVRVHKPTIRETARIKALRSEFLFGTAQNTTTDMFFETMFILNEADEGTQVFDKNGRIVKDYFSLDKYAREDVVLAIANDVFAWMATFRG